MFVNNLSPEIIKIGFLEIRYYGLIYVLGALLGLWFLKRASQKNKIKLDKDEIYDLVLWLLIGMLIGSRLFTVFIFNPTYYFSQPWWKIFALWEGGMSFHGGLTGILLSGYIFCKKKNTSLLKISDILTIPLMFALALGRIANFINRELVGTITDVEWCVVFPNIDQECRHPYQLYEAGKRFLILGWLIYLNKKEWKEGFLLWNLILFEGAGRFLLDFYNYTPNNPLLTTGQYLSIIMIIISIYFLNKNHKTDIKNIIT